MEFINSCKIWGRALLTFALYLVGIRVNIGYGLEVFDFKSKKIFA